MLQTADGVPDLTVSVVVPTHARPESLGRCIAALARLDYPRRLLEVVVVDDGSPRPVSLEAPARLALQVIRQQRSGPGAARNTGVAAASGAVIAFVDDDCEPEPEWVDRLVRRLEDEPGTVLGGRVVNALTDNPYSEASQALVSYLYRSYGARESARIFFTTNNLALRREAFLAVGGFDPAFRRAAGEDREFCARCLRAGYRLAYAPDAVVRHSHELSLRSFWNQQLTYGREGYRFHRRLAAGRRLELEPLSFYGRLLAAPFSQGLRRPLRASALLAVSQVAIASGFVRESLAQRRPPPSA